MYAEFARVSRLCDFVRAFAFDKKLIISPNTSLAVPTGLSWNFLSFNQLINETIYLICCYFDVSLICFAYNGYL